MTTGNITIKQVLLKRGTTAQNLTYTGPVGELTIDTDLDTVRVHDGSTPGGINILATNNQVAALANSISTITGLDGAFVANINNLLSNAAAQGAQIAATSSNVAVLTAGLTAANARIDTISTTFGNANVAGYLAHYDQSINFVGFPATISGLANIYSTNYFYPNGQSIFTSISANAASQAADILTLYSNAAVQSVIINNMTANAGAYQAYANTQIISLTSNAGTQGATLASILANIGAFETYANTTFATGGGSSYGNSNVAGYLPVNGTILGINANVTAANAAIQTLNANTGAYQTWANATFGTSSYGNANVAGYLAGNISVGNISLGNYTQFHGADNSFTTTNGSKISVNSRLDVTGVGVGIGMLVTNLLQANGGLAVSGNSNATAFYGGSYNYANGVSILTGIGGTYSNANVTSYLPTYSGNIGNISFASGNLNLGAMQTPMDQTGTIYNVKGIVGMTASSGANISGFNTVSAGNFTFSNGTSILSGVSDTVLRANVGSYQTWANATFGGAATYGNTQVAAYLTQYTGNLASGDFESHGNVKLDYRLTVLGDVNGLSTIVAGLPNYTVLPYTIAQFSSTANSYAQFNIQNESSGTQATTDYVATASNGTDSTYYVDLGIAGPTYNGANPANNLGTALYPNDAYVYTEGNAAATAGGNLVVGAVTPTKNIKFVAGGHDLANVAVIINNPNTPATDNMNGTMVVNGGLAVSSNINVGSLATSLHSIRGNLLLGGGGVQDSADSILTINLSNVAPIVSNAVVHIAGNTDQTTVVGVDSVGQFAPSFLSLRHARGQAGFPLAVQRDDLMGGLTAKGYGTTGYSNISSTITTGITFWASENYTNVAQGMYMQIRTVANGANTATTTIRIDSTNVSIPNANVVASNYLFNNGASILSTIAAGTYGNANVVANLQSLTTNISTTANVTGDYLLLTSGIRPAFVSSPAPFITGFGSISTTATGTNEGNIIASGNLVASRGAFITGNVQSGNVITTNAILGNTISRNDPNTILLINQASTTPLNTPTAVVHINGGQDRSVNIVGDAFGNNASVVWISRKARGTTGSPSAAGSNDCLLALLGQGYGTTGFQNANVQTVPGFSVHTREVFTDSAQGTRAEIRTTPIGSNVAVVAVLVDQNSNVVIPGSTTSTSTTTGELVVPNGGVGIGGNLTVGGNIVQQSAYYETYSNISNTGGNLTCNFNQGAMFYAALTANVTANFTNVNAVTSTVTGATIVVDQGATAYRIANVQVNGVNQTVKWVGATVGTGTASNTDVMSFSLINLGGGTYRVLGQISSYG